MLGLNTFEAITAIATSATVLVGLMVYWVAQKSHLHELASSGIVGSLRVQAVPKSWRPQSFSGLPGDWNTKNVRYFGLRAYNLAPYATRMYLKLDELLIGGKSYKVEASELNTEIRSQFPKSFPIFIYSEHGWPSQTFQRKIEIPIYTNSDEILYKKKATFKSLIPPDSSRTFMTYDDPE